MVAAFFMSGLMGSDHYCQSSKRCTAVCSARPSDHPPATFHLFFEQLNYDLKVPNGRWWADSSSVIYNLGSQDGQTLTFVAPLTPDIWGNVVGEKTRKRFLPRSQTSDGLE